MHKHEKKSKHKSIISRVLSILVVCLFALPAGYCLGNWYLSKYYFIDPSLSYSESELVDNLAEIDFAGKTPDQLKAYEVYLVALDKLNSRDFYEVTSSGKVNAQITTQDVYNYVKKDGSNFYSESYSTGIVNIVVKAETASNGQIAVSEGKPSSDNSTVAWESSNLISADVFKSTYGKSYSDPWALIISSKTITNNDVVCNYEDGKYTFKVSLNASAAAINYKQQIKYFSGLNETPKFTKIDVSFTVDKDFNFISFSSNEIYTMNYLGVKVTVSSSETDPLTTSFNYNR